MTVATEEPLVIHELFFSSEGGVEEELQLSDDEKKKVIWKDVLREGTFAMTPGLAGAQRKPFKVIADGQSDPSQRIISMSDIMDAHNDKAFEHVTIPTRHADELLDNTGYVPQPGGLRTVKRDDGYVMQAALGFTEPDIAGRVRRGTIPNVSCGIFFDFVRKADGKKFRAALKHVALTHTPFINKLEPFKAVLASDDEIEGEFGVETFQFADEGAVGETDNSEDKATIVWKEQDGAGWLARQISESLRPTQPEEDGRPYVPQPYYYVRDTSDVTKSALVEESYKGESKTFIIPFERSEDGVVVAPSTRWTEAREAMIAASDDNFVEMTSGSIREKLGLALSDMAGEGQNYRIGEITLDQRVEVISDDKKWVAGFAVFSDGHAILDPSSRWAPGNNLESATKETQEGSQRSTPLSRRKALLSDDIEVEVPDEASVRAARQRRRQLTKS